jgi:hypothetical protein
MIALNNYPNRSIYEHARLYLAYVNIFSDIETLISYDTSMRLESLIYLRI